MPVRFPYPDDMHQGDKMMWTNWLNEELQGLLKDFDKEVHLLQEEDDPF